MIDPITGAALAEALIGTTAAMQGQSLADAYNQRITGQYETNEGPTIGYADYISDTPAISGDTSGTISDSSEIDPVDAWHDYVENEVTNVSDVTGGIVSGSSAYTFAYSLMEENPGTASAVVKAIAPVAVPVQAAIVAMGQALGVSIDSANLEAEIKDALVNSFVSTTGVIYDQARGLVTAWKDEWGRILFPKRALDAVNQALLDNNIGPEGEGAVPADNPYGLRAFVFSAYNGYYLSDGPYSRIATFTGSPDITGEFGVILATENNVGGNSFTYEGKTVYYYHVSGTSSVFLRPPFTQVLNADGWAGDTRMCAWAMVYGYEIGQYPEGTSASDATSYTPSTIPIAGDLATSYDPDTGILGTEPLVPIHLTDDPYNATGDTTDPVDPTDEGNPGVVDPPIPLPIPDTRPSNPSVPLVNPSIVDSTLVQELVNELANTLDPQPPQSSGIIPVPALPGIGDPPTFPSIIPASGPGFIHVYNPTPAEFVAFGTWLWVTYADATIDKILNNPFDGVIGAHELYATPNTDGSDNIRSAFLTCPTTAALVPNRYSEIDCGTVIIPEFYGNYLDYSPYSQAYVYLPFIGINEVSIDDIVGHAVNIRYRVDSYSGSCIAMIFVAKDGYQNLCYQFAGSCSVEVPMAGGSQAAIKAGEMQAEAYSRAGIANAALNGAAAIGSGLATGGLAGGLLGGLSALGGIAGAWYSGQRSIDAARIANKSTVQHSGQFGASHGAMGKKEPFIIIRNPIQVKVTNYHEDYGFPAHKRVIVGGCRGYLRVREVNVVSAHATDEEKIAIEMALKNGVYVS